MLINSLDKIINVASLRVKYCEQLKTFDQWYINQHSIFDILTQNKSLFNSKPDRYNILQMVEECELLIIFNKELKQKFEEYSPIASAFYEVKDKIEKFKAKAHPYFDLNEKMLQKILHFSENNVIY